MGETIDVDILFKIKSIYLSGYLSILSRPVDKDSNCTELCRVVHVCSAGFAACTCPTLGFIVMLVVLFAPVLV